MPNELMGGRAARVGGRELDAEVAEKVMGRRWYQHTAAVVEQTYMPGHRRVRFLATPEWAAAVTYFCEPADMSLPPASDNDPAAVPCYSTDIEAATSVAEHLREKLRLCYVIGTSAYSPQNGVKFYEGFRGVGRDLFNAEQHEGWYAVANTIPLAICRAALEVVASPQFHAAGVTTAPNDL